MLSVKAFSSSAPDVEGAKKAVFHYEKSIQLYGTGHENINMIRQHIAFIYGSIGEYGRAIDYLTQTGEGTHEVQIADYTLKMGNYDEAKLRLQSVLFNFAFNFCWLTGTLMKCFEREGDAATVLKLTKLNAEFREYFANSDSPNYFDDLSSFDFSRLAAEYKKAGDHEAMWDALSKAVSHAVRFDTNPSYDLSNVGFMKGYKGYVSNSSSHQACLPLIRYIEENFFEFKDNPRYTEFVHELRNAQSNKKQSGIWE